MNFKKCRTMSYIGIFMILVLCITFVSLTQVYGQEKLKGKPTVDQIKDVISSVKANAEEEEEKDIIPSSDSWLQNEEQPQIMTYSIEPGAKFSADGIDVVCTGLEEEPRYNLFDKCNIGFDVTNNSQYTVGFETKNNMVNGYRVQDIVVDLGGSVITPGNSSHMFTYVDDDVITMLHTDVIQEVSYRWIYWEDVMLDKIAIDIPITIKTSAYGEKDVQPDLLSKNVFFDKDGIKVSYVGTGVGENYHFPMLGFAIQNTTEKTLNFWAYTVAANNTMLNLAADYVTIDPGEKGILVIHSVYGDYTVESFVGKDIEVYISALDDYYVPDRLLGPLNFIINEDETITII